jgi:hypothetical protein
MDFISTHEILLFFVRLKRIGFETISPLLGDFYFQSNFPAYVPFTPNHSPVPVLFAAAHIELGMAFSSSSVMTTL